MALTIPPQLPPYPISHPRPCRLDPVPPTENPIVYRGSREVDAMHRFVLQNMRAPDPLPRVSLSQGVLNVEQVAGDTRRVLALICLKDEDETCFASADEKHVRQWDGPGAWAQL